MDVLAKALRRVVEELVAELQHTVATATVEAAVDLAARQLHRSVSPESLPEMVRCLAGHRLAGAMLIGQAAGLPRPRGLTA